MEKSVQKIFEQYLLDRLREEKARLPESVRDLPFEEQVKLNQKFSALKRIDKILKALPKMPQEERVSLIQEKPSRENQVIGGCKIIRTLGQGGMGIVYLGFQEKLGREVAVKVLHEFAAANPSLRERFQRESKLIARLEHPNIVPVYDIGQEGNTFYILMKYVQGVPLDVLIDRMEGQDRSTLKIGQIESILKENLPESDPVHLKEKNSTEFFCRLVDQVAQALEYAHGRGVVHRDVKPSNILIGADGRPVLLDFGLGRQEGDQSRTLSGEFLGTPVYSAPENFQSKDPANDKLLDVYSLGVTFYELLTGALPYHGDSVYEVYSNLKDQDPVNPKKYWQGLPQDLATILLTSIQKAPEFRYSSVKAFREDLERFLNYQPILAQPPSLAHRLYYFLRRRSLQVTAVVLFLALGGWIIYSMVLSQDLRRTKEQEALYQELNQFDQIRRTKNQRLLSEVQALNQASSQTLNDWLENRFQGEESTEQTVQRLEGQLKKNPQDISIMEELAEAYLDQGNLRQVEELGTKILKQDPRDFAGYLLLANLYLVQTNQINKAIPLIQDFNQYFPNETGANALLGIHCLVNQNEDCAVEFLGLAARQNPKQFLKFLAIAYMEKGNYKKAIDAYQTALVFYPQEADLYDSLALAYGKMDRFPQALKYAEQAIALEPENVPRKELVQALHAQLAQQQNLSTPSQGRERAP